MRLSATDLNRGVDYPEIMFDGYSLREALAVYKERFNLKYKRGIQFYLHRVNFEIIALKRGKPSRRLRTLSEIIADLPKTRN